MIPALDFYLAPYVKQSFVELLEEIMIIAGLTSQEMEILRSRKVEKYEKKETKELIGLERIWQLTINKTVKEMNQTMEGFVHDLNLMASRAGTQVPLFDR